MRKKLFIAATLLALPLQGFSQQAFQSLAFGIEAGTSGVGVELAMPLITDHLVLKAGFNAPSLTVSRNFDISMAEVNASIATVNSNLAAVQLPDRIDVKFNDVDLKVTPTLNLSTVKAMLELYPFRKSSFHLTAGVYYGMEGSFFSATAVTDRAFWTEFKSLRSQVDGINEKYKDVPGYTPADISSIKVNLKDRTFEVQEKDGAGSLEAAVDLPKFRPYLGLGFGRSVPKRGVGLQFDLGVIYHGAPSLTSPNEVAYDASAQDIMPNGLAVEDLKLYPVASLRLTVRLF